MLGRVLALAALTPLLPLVSWTAHATGPSASPIHALPDDMLLQHPSFDARTLLRLARTSRHFRDVVVRAVPEFDRLDAVRVEVERACGRAFVEYLLRELYVGDTDDEYDDDAYAVVASAPGIHQEDLLMSTTSNEVIDMPLHRQLLNAECARAVTTMCQRRPMAAAQLRGSLRLSMAVTDYAEALHAVRTVQGLVGCETSLALKIDLEDEHNAAPSSAAANADVTANADALAHALTSATSPLTALHVHVEGRPLAARMLAHILLHATPALTSIHFSETFFSAADQKLLITSMARNPRMRLERFAWRWQEEVGVVGADYDGVLWEFFRAMRGSLRWLDLSCADVTDATVVGIVETFASSSYVNDAPADDMDMAHAGALEDGVPAALQTLILRENEVSCASLRVLFAAMTNDRLRLRHLNLSYLYAVYDCIQPVAHMLRHNRHLERIELNAWGLDEDGVRMIVEAVEAAGAGGQSPLMAIAMKGSPRVSRAMVQRLRRGGWRVEV